jgi:DNA-binding response OmpR family regulator
MRLLVVEDFQPLRESLSQGFREAGYAVDEASDGQTALWHARAGEHDVIILDIMLPKIDGLTVLRQLREQSSPSQVLLLTAKDTAEDKINGLELGADDYLVKPFLFAELLARVKALVRRKYETKSTVLRVADLEVDISRRSVRRGGKPIDLSGREYALLEYLTLNTDKPTSGSTSTILMPRPRATSSTYTSACCERKSSAPAPPVLSIPAAVRDIFWRKWSPDDPIPSHAPFDTHVIGRGGDPWSALRGSLCLHARINRV